jgi:MFS-type transporter involved in bile tolerance (Atg22 family)
VGKEQPQTAWFLVLFFFFSDGYTTIATVSVIFASRELCLGGAVQYTLIVSTLEPIK